ncbi:MAG TPA: 3'(2'),5'-bisphosphate nucleotidase CysQ [Chitinophagales bacterium]|nr:3'(2'),5'-bisphosphate nucleotidase CysQ [Chitinophagales bacterium]
MKYKEIDIEELLAIAQQAGDAIMEIYARDFEVIIKEDKSPLTEADKKSNAVIIAGLQKSYPAIPFISEETKLTPYEERKNWTRFWLIDPIDGTKEFIKKNGEFTVNIALIEDGVPVVGIVHVPAQNKTYYGVKGEGSFKYETGKQDSTIKLTNDTHYNEKQSVLVVASRSHLDEKTLSFVEELKAAGKEVDFLSSGSSIKFCLVAEGAADVYPRFGPTMEWDTGAAHAVALYAGRNVINTETGKPLIYNKENLLNPYFIVE